MYMTLCLSPIIVNIIRRGNPKGFVIHYDKISHNLECIFLKLLEILYDNFPNFCNVPNDLHEWARENIRPENDKTHRPISRILEGPSRMGKTYWTRSLGTHNYYCNHVDLAHHNDDVCFNIIDDVPPKFLKHWHEFIGAQRD